MMTTTKTSSSLSPEQLTNSLNLFEVKPGVQFSRQSLIDIFDGDIETALFFGAVYELDVTQLSALIAEFFQSDLIVALTTGDHSVTLQNYLVDELNIPAVKQGKVKFSKKVHPKGEILPQLWASLEIQVATSIADVANKLRDVIGLMPGKQGRMTFQSLKVMNAKRPIIGDYRARIVHDPVKENLVIFDVSGSVSRPTAEKIVDDVVALGFMANAHLAIVSNSTRHWNPGEYTTKGVMKKAEFRGTHYETLAPLFDRDWGVVVCIADYDGSPAAKQHIAKTATGHIDKVVDVSLVNRPTYLSEVVGQISSEVQPVLVANSWHGLH